MQNTGQNNVVRGEKEQHAATRIHQLATTLQRRQLSDALLLLLVSHRPLTFFAGQLLYALAPACALLGWDVANAWATRLSAPDANQRLITLLATPQPPTTQPSASNTCTAK